MCVYGGGAVPQGGRQLVTVPQGDRLPWGGAGQGGGGTRCYSISLKQHHVTISGGGGRPRGS